MTKNPNIVAAADPKPEDRTSHRNASAKHNLLERDVQVDTSKGLWGFKIIGLTFRLIPLNLGRLFNELRKKLLTNV
jgi:hypothetical protein